MLGGRLTRWFEPVARRLPERTGRVVVLGLLAITLTTIVIPLMPVMPALPLDESWAFGLNQALADGRAFGRDILFTFGPYSNVFSMQYHPATDGLMLLASTYLAACFWLAIARLTLDGRRWLPWAILAVLVIVMPARDARDALLMSYPLIAALACLRIGASATGQSPRALLATSAITSAFGLLPLIKGSMSVSCGLIGAAVIVSFALERRWRLVAAVAVPPLVALVAFWLVAGQPLGALVGYLTSMLTIMSGYADAMSVPGALVEVLIYLGGCALLVAVLLRQRVLPLRERLVLTACYGALFFIALKAGFVRHDSHALIPGQCLVLAGVVFAGTSSSRFAPGVALAGVLVWGTVHVRHSLPGHPNAYAKTTGTFRAARNGLVLRLTSNGLDNTFDDTLAALARIDHIPKLEGTTDIYSFGQTALIASGNRWSPRPVMQSYAAYAPSLAARNRAHLLGSDAPDNILFRLETIDARLPPLDDGASWPVLLQRYEPRSLVNDILVLGRRSTANVEPTTIATTTGHLGRSVGVPASDGLVFVELELEPSLLGRVAAAFYKAPTLSISLRLGGNSARSYRLVAAMGRAGFLLSPLIESTPELALLYGPTELLDGKRAVSFNVTAMGSKRFWQRDYKVTFKRLALAPVADPEHMVELAFGRPLDDALRDVAIDAVLDACDGVIDQINGYRNPPGYLSTIGALSVSGWAARSAKLGELGDGVLLVLTDEAGVHTAFATRMVARPDVGSYFGDPRLANAGYTATVDVSTHAGTYTVSLAFRTGDRVELCPRSLHTVRVIATR